VGDEGSKRCCRPCCPALLPQPDFTLYGTAGAILLLLLGRAIPFPSAGACGVGDSVLTLGTSGPQPSAHPRAAELARAPP